jgi:hypothetical protein
MDSSRRNEIPSGKQRSEYSTADDSPRKGSVSPDGRCATATGRFRGSHRSVDRRQALEREVGPGIDRGAEMAAGAVGGETLVVLHYSAGLRPELGSLRGL